MVVVVTFGSPISLKSFSDNSRMRSRVRRGGLASMSSGPGEPEQRRALAFQTASRTGLRFVEVSGDYNPVVRMNFRGFLKVTVSGFQPAFRTAPGPSARAAARQSPHRSSRQRTAR